jgi:hypothetical protein
MFPKFDPLVRAAQHITHLTLSLARYGAMIWEI